MKWQKQRIHKKRVKEGDLTINPKYHLLGMSVPLGLFLCLQTSHSYSHLWTFKRQRRTILLLMPFDWMNSWTSFFSSGVLGSYLCRSLLHLRTYRWPSMESTYFAIKTTLGNGIVDIRCPDVIVSSLVSRRVDRHQLGHTWGPTLCIDHIRMCSFRIEFASFSTPNENQNGQEYLCDSMLQSGLGVLWSLRRGRLLDGSGSLLLFSLWKFGNHYDIWGRKLVVGGLWACRGAAVIYWDTN